VLQGLLALLPHLCCWCLPLMATVSGKRAELDHKVAGHDGLKPAATAFTRHIWFLPRTMHIIDPLQVQVVVAGVLAYCNMTSSTWAPITSPVRDTCDCVDCSSSPRQLQGVSESTSIGLSSAACQTSSQL